MGQSGEITFFSRRLPDEPERAVADLLTMSGVRRAFTVYRSDGPDVGWARWQQEWKLLTRGGGPLRRWLARPVRLEDLGRDIPVENIPGLYRSNRRLFVFVQSGGPIATPIYDAVLRIPSEIRDTFAPGTLAFSVGSHDIFETSEHDEGFLFGRAGVDVVIEGQGSPSNWKLCRKVILELPEVQSLKARCEDILGPLEQCVYWNA